MFDCNQITLVGMIISIVYARNSVTDNQQRAESLERNHCNCSIDVFYL